MNKMTIAQNPRHCNLDILFIIFLCFQKPCFPFTNVQETVSKSQSVDIWVIVGSKNPSLTPPIQLKWYQIRDIATWTFFPLNFHLFQKPCFPLYECTRNCVQITICGLSVESFSNISSSSHYTCPYSELCAYSPKCKWDENRHFTGGKSIVRFRMFLSFRISAAFAALKLITSGPSGRWHSSFGFPAVHRIRMRGENTK